MGKSRVTLSLVILLAGLLAFFNSGVSGAIIDIETFGFYHVVEPGDGATELADGATGEAQLFVDVINDNDCPGQVVFRFRNEGPIDSRINDVYFDNGSLLGIAELIDIDDGIAGDDRVDFSEGASPGDLPGGNNVIPEFEVTEFFLADSDSPGKSDVENPYKPGVGALDGDQWLGICFDLIGGQTYTDVIDELNGGELLRIGIHVQSFPLGGSEAFVNTPEPATLGLLLIGGLAILRRRSH